MITLPFLVTFLPRASRSALIISNRLISDDLAMHHVFVYGTLKRDEPNHHWLTDSNNGKALFVGDGRIQTKYPLIIATKYNIPFLLFKPGTGHNVIGEVYEIDEKMLYRLDELEEHPRYYQREIEEIVIEPGGEKSTYKAWVYFLKNFKPELLGKQYLANYSSKGAHGLVYVERSKRDPKYDYKVEVQ